MISQFAQRLSQELQDSLPMISNLLPKRELNTALQSALSKLNLVSREEFDAQSAVLQRTRLKLEALEARCTEIEEKLKQPAQK